MRTVSLFLLAIAAAVGAPLLAADEAPSAGANLCELAQNPLPVDFEFHALCTITVDCGAFPDKSCSTGAGGECDGKDRNCSSGSFGQRGYVTCNGSTTYCAGRCCGSDGTCEYFQGCGCDDPDCCDLLECRRDPACSPCAEDGTCNTTCGCPKDPDCCTCQQCPSITNCTSDAQCSEDCPGSICTSSGMCLCAG